MPKYGSRNQRGGNWFSQVDPLQFFLLMILMVPLTILDALLGLFGGSLM
jgi:hypothetical protein